MGASVDAVGCDVGATVVMAVGEMVSPISVGALVTAVGASVDAVGGNVGGAVVMAVGEMVSPIFVGTLVTAVGASVAAVGAKVRSAAILVGANVWPSAVGAEVRGLVGVPDGLILVGACVIGTVGASVGSLEIVGDRDLVGSGVFFFESNDLLSGNNRKQSLLSRPCRLIRERLPLLLLLPPLLPSLRPLLPLPPFPFPP